MAWRRIKMKARKKHRKRIGGHPILFLTNGVRQRKLGIDKDGML
jgi:hypothetical protein